MTRTVIAVAALALAARASATNGPKPEKAVGKKGCDICSGGTVDAYAHAGGFCKIDDDVFDLNVTEAECYHDHSNSWISRTCGEVAQEYMEANLNATECKSGQEFAASLCCSDTGGGNAANSPRPTSKPTGQSRGSGPGDGNDGNGPRRPPPGAVAIIKWEDDPGFLIPYLGTVSKPLYEAGMNWSHGRFTRGYDEGDTFMRFVALSRSGFVARPMCAKFEVTCRVDPFINVVVGMDLPPEGRPRRRNTNYGGELGVGDRITTDAGADGVVVGFGHGWWEVRLDGTESTKNLRREQITRAAPHAGDAGEEPDATADAPATVAERLASLEARLGELNRPSWAESRANLIEGELRSYTTDEIPDGTEEQLRELRRRISNGELPGAPILEEINGSPEAHWLRPGTGFSQDVNGVATEFWAPRTTSYRGRNGWLGPATKALAVARAKAMYLAENVPWANREVWDAVPEQVRLLAEHLRESHRQGRYPDREFTGAQQNHEPNTGFRMTANGPSQVSRLGGGDRRVQLVSWDELERARRGEVDGVLQPGTYRYAWDTSVYLERSDGDKAALKVKLDEQRSLTAIARDLASVMNQQDLARLGDKVDQHLVDIARESGFTLLTDEEKLPFDYPYMLHLGDPRCPAHEVAMNVFYGAGCSSGRDYDKRKDLIMAKLKENNSRLLREMFIACMPILKNKKFKKVLNYLVAYCQLDHILTASTDHPSNLFVEMRGLNGHWGIDRNARGKAARYGKDVMDRAVAFLQDAINTVLKIIQ